MLLAVVVDPPELDPGVTEPLRVRMRAAEQQVPLHRFFEVGISSTPVRRRVTVQQERRWRRTSADFPVPLLPRSNNRPSRNPELLGV